MTTAGELSDHEFMNDWYQEHRGMQVDSYTKTRSSGERAYWPTRKVKLRFRDKHPLILFAAVMLFTVCMLGLAALLVIEVSK